MYTYEKLEKNQVKVKVSLTKEEWDAAVESAYQKTKGKYKVQGFRNGKAPRKMIEANYGESIFFDEALDNVISREYYAFLTKEKDVEPVSQPEVEIDGLDDKGLRITITVDTMPEIKLGAYTGLEFKRAETKVSDEDVNAELERVRDTHARFIEKEQPAKMGDFVSIDFEGSIDGKLFEGGASKDYRLELGSHSFIDGFEEQIVGMKINEEKDINVTFPENYHAEDLKGKPAVFKVKLNKVEVKELPELNDSFASDVSEFDTLEEYKKGIKDKLTANLAKKNENELENAMIEAIAKSSSAEIPESMIQRQIDSFIGDLEMRLSYQGIKLEDYAKYTNTTIEDMRKEKHDQAEEYVKTRLCLEKIIKDNNITVSKEEIDNKVKEYADRFKKSVEEYKAQLSDRDLAYIENDILMDKLFAFLKEKNNIK